MAGFGVIKADDLEHAIDLVALTAQYVYETFGKFPATVPSIFSLMYLLAHHLGLEFYDITSLLGLPADVPRAAELLLSPRSLPPDLCPTSPTSGKLAL